MAENNENMMSLENAGTTSIRNVTSGRSSSSISAILPTTAAPEEHNIHQNQGNRRFTGKPNVSTQGAIRSNVNSKGQLPRNPSMSYAMPLVGVHPPREYTSVPVSNLSKSLTKKEKDSPSQLEPSSTDDSAFYRLLSKYAPLFMAALKGDWEVAERFFEKHPEAIGEPITETMETVLHIAAGTEHTRFVEELVRMMDIDQLRKRNWEGETAISFAAASGVTDNAKTIINRDKQLRITNVRGENGLDERLPCKELDSSLYKATTRGHKKMVRYLYHMTTEAVREYNIFKTGKSCFEVDYTKLFVAALSSGLYDFAWELLALHEKIAARQVELLQCVDDILPKNLPDDVQAVSRKRINDTTAFQVLSRKPQAFYSANRLNAIQLLLYQCLPVNLKESFLTPAKQSFGNQIFSVLLYLVPCLQLVRDEKRMHCIVIQLLQALSQNILSSQNVLIRSCVAVLFPLLFKAAELGIVEFLVVLIRLNPDFLWKVNEDGHTIFHVAVKHRRKNVFYLLDQFGATAIKDFVLVLKDKDGNNMLHLAAKIPPPNQLKTDSGAALQLRQELLWFTEIEKMMPPSYREMENLKGETPQSILGMESKELVKEGEEWIKTASASCMVVSTLIATVSFAALFTLPGGNKENTGEPVFRKRIAFKFFVISDSLSLVSSIYSILKFLWILIPRHAVEDFLQAVPNMLAVGLITLFISVASMMVAFGAALFIAIGDDLQWLAITIAVVSGFIVASFLKEQFSIMANIVSVIFNIPKFFQWRKYLF